MTSDNVNILSFEFGQLFNGRAIKIDQCKRAREGPLLSFYSIAAARLNRLCKHLRDILMCFGVTKFRYNEYNFVTRTISLY
jgi:hypothetical protein